MSIFPRLHKFTPVAKNFPLVGAEGAVTYTKGGKMARVVELTGRDYTGLSDGTLAGLYHGRKMFFDSIPTNITVMSQSHRQIIARDLRDESYSVPVAQEIAARWSQGFSSSYRTRHFFIFVTADDSLAEKALLAVQNAGEETTNKGEMARVLADAVENAIIHFKDYGARELEGDDLATYWAWLLNGRHVHQAMPPDGLFDDLLTGTRLAWPSGKRVQEYEGPHGKRFSAWLIIKAAAHSTSQGMLDHLFSVKREFSIYQTLSRLDKQQSRRIIEDKEKNRKSFVSASEIIQMELNELDNRVQADEINLLRHRFALEVFGATEKELEEAARELSNVVQNWGYQVGREGMNQEALFWSRFPELQTYNTRQRNMTSENAAHFVTLASVGEGLESCTWGQTPVTFFKTITGSDYSFTFHESPAKQAPGSTIIIGGMGSGKTTFISLLMSQCLKYRNFKILAFDRLKGLEVFTKFHDGTYLDFMHNPDVNPLQLEDSPVNRAFLQNFLQGLVGSSSNHDQEIIGDAVKQLYDFEKSQRTLTNLADAFGTKKENSIREALNKWLPEGPYGSYFSGTRDALDFSTPLVSFDMSHLLELPEVLWPMTSYLFHKLFLSRKGDGYMVFIDELPKYLRSKEFVPKIEILLEEIRKTEGVFVGAVQEAGSVLEHEILAAKFRNNISTWVLFPEPLANPKHYMDILRLTDREFDWIKKPHTRKVMIKRKGGESVILDCDLSPLGPYLKTMDSATAQVERRRALEKEYPNDWKALFLA